jgi:3-oxoacyl-[acyl-carrier-protein] synthase-3
MLFHNVVVASVAHVLPDEIVSSSELEERLAPLYGRLGLSSGRLELMTGIRERRFFPPNTRPSEISARAGELAIEKSRVARESVGLVVHAAVCRDFLEPATASVVHHRLHLAPRCVAFDLSNACLGFANAMAFAASSIERGDLEAALIVSGEDGRLLVESTLAALTRDATIGRRELKNAFASLTIGSGGAAMMLARESLARGAPRLAGSVSLSATEHHELCRGDTHADFAGPLMETDSERLLDAGCELAARTFEAFRSELGWTRDSIERVITHQVGSAHRRRILHALELDPSIDFPTVETLGNVGSASLPLTLSCALEAGFVRAGERVAMLGIGSGLQCQMLGLEC